jgi:DNA helicase-2/ATP-dependent DNA helicase PcrA
LINTARSNWEKSRGFADISLPLGQYKGELDDERRLFYVAITRAKTHLSISSSKQDWYGKAMEPSQFISELSEASVCHEVVDEFESGSEAELIRFFSNEPLHDSVFDAEYLAARFAEENLSVTALNNYLECPRKYLFRNLIQIPDVYTPALRYGDTIHRALENFFKASVEEKKILAKTVLLDAYETAMNTSGFFDKDYDTFLKKGRQSLGMYYDYYHTWWSLNVSLEEYIRATLVVDDVELTISGKIDKLEFHDELGSGRVRVIDYKTGKVFSKKTTKAQKEALERQIQFYYLLLQNYKEGDIKVEEAMLDFVEPSDDGTFEQKSLTVTSADLEHLTEQIHFMAQAVRSGAFLEQGCQKKDCEACQFWETIHT